MQTHITKTNTKLVQMKCWEFILKGAFGRIVPYIQLCSMCTCTLCMCACIQWTFPYEKKKSLFSLSIVWMFSVLFDVRLDSNSKVNSVQLTRGIQLKTFLSFICCTWHEINLWFSSGDRYFMWCDKVTHPIIKSLRQAHQTYVKLCVHKIVHAWWVLCHTTTART